MSSAANRHPASWVVAENELTETDCEPSDIPANNGWYCLRCRTKHRHGDPLIDRCPDCNFLLGEDPR